MSDTFYRAVRLLGSTAFAVSACPVILGIEHVPRAAAFLLAATHQSPYDVALLIRHTPRPLDFVSITELFRIRPVAAFFGALNAFPLDRSRPDAPTVRTIVERLRAGRAVAMFPEGAIQPPDSSAIRTGRIRRGLGRLAALATAPIIPCVVINSAAYKHPAAWLPLRRTRYGVIYGPPLPPTDDHAALEAAYIAELRRLHRALSEAMERTITSRP